jgi:hypothetical protein
MVRGGRTGRPVKGGKQVRKSERADWTSGLKQLYDSVIDEPLPDAFKDLLSKLDDNKK